jgi:hypothetical protein
MDTPTLIGIGLVALVGFWLFGGIVMRTGGALLVLAGGGALALSGGRVAVFLLVAGATLWGLGRTHRAVRRRA